MGKRILELKIRKPKNTFLNGVLQNGKTVFQNGFSKSQKEKNLESSSRRLFQKYVIEFQF